MSLDPKTHIKMGIPTDQIKYIAGHSKLTYDQVLILIRNVLEDTLSDVIMDLELWIKSKVPKRTGQLRESLIANLHSSRVKNGLLRLILGTHLDYAAKVASYSTSQVRHMREKGYAYYYGHYGRITLDDPRAIGNFFDKMLEFAKERVDVRLIEAKNRYLGSSGKPGRMIRTRL